MAKEKITPGDTFPVMFEARELNLEAPDDPYGLPAELSSGYARLYDSLEGEFVEIGGTGVTTAPVTIIPRTGPYAGDRGAIASYRLPAAFTATPGSTYVLYITMLFVDGNIRTELVKLVVNEIQ